MRRSWDVGGVGIKDNSGNDDGIGDDSAITISDSNYSDDDNTNTNVKLLLLRTLHLYVSSMDFSVEFICYHVICLASAVNYLK